MKILLSAALMLTASVAEAQPAAVSPAALRKLAECRALTPDVTRLACYDSAAAGLMEAEAKGDIVVVDRDQARQVRRQAFGFALPSLAILGAGKGDEEDVDEITAKVAGASQGGDGKWVIRLEDGQTWRQIDGEQLARNPKAGVMVTIKRAMMGSYKLSTGGAAAIRVRRDD